MAHNTYEGDMTRIRDEEFDSANTKSGSENQEGGSGDEQDPRSKRKRYHRHTQHQIQEMQAFFKEYLHPDNKQRKELSRELGADNMWYKEDLNNASCPNWGGPTSIGEMSFDEHHLRLENTRWREEIDQYFNDCFARRLTKMNNLDGIESVLNEDEYTRIFSHGVGPKPVGFKREASRESAVVITNHINLVEYLMDVNSGSTVFSDIVSRVLI
ncbi:HOMEOBOX-LEUCINE ZIPPER PROTEIN MERISTEM L1 [Salix purpurea]|uniref:HOMEOBOX-LEUCINE ZIPPER PROTEIN MERISTEM L1 n=1 Tax=Salix purpurea TaxID=77065 RepID=A0A9Q0WPT0_SALPP|nr:HOMEOBOX-LEUCINE ZIPPER PROTEIN MERISTEM L1 [Salix purpurea]